MARSAQIGILLLTACMGGLAACAAEPGTPHDRAEWPARIRDAVAMLADTNAPCTLASAPRCAKHVAPHRFDVDVRGLDHLWISVGDGGDGIGGDHTCWVDPVLTDTNGVQVSATDLPVFFHRTGWEKLYVVNGREGRRRRLEVASTVYTNGWWFHPKGTMCLKLDRRFARFTVGAGTDRSAHPPGGVGFSLESRLEPRWLRQVLTDSLALEFPDIDRWLATELNAEGGGHRALFALPSVRQLDFVARFATPRALDRLACRDALAFARKTCDMVARARPVPALAARLDALDREAAALAQDGDWAALCARARALRREIVFSHPALDFADLLVNLQPPPRYPHQCDQYLGRHNAAGRGLAILKGWKGGKPEVVELTRNLLPPGAVAHPDLSFDAKKVAFAYSACTNTWNARRFRLWEVNVDGTGLHPLTGGPGDPLRGEGGRETVVVEDFDPCYLPDGGLVFVSTRCQSFGRCHAGRYNPSYMLYRMDGDGSGIRQLSFGEANEWDPSVLPDGRVVYTRWDYVNRHDTFFQSLWTIHPDGTGTAHFYGNYTVNPCMTAEARAVPGTGKVVATAMAHHGYTSGSLIHVDPARGEDGPDPITRLTPEVAFPETEADKGGGAFHSPWPLCEDLTLAAYTPLSPSTREENAYGIVLVDSLGGREEIFRDPKVSAVSPIPLVPRPVPHVLPSALPACPRNTPGTVYIQNVNKGGHDFGAPVRSVRVNEIIGQPTANVPHRGLVMQELLKRPLGTAEVAADGSAAFTVPSGKPLQLQLLDGDGLAVMTMRSFIYAQPGETVSCVGCHEPRTQAPAPAAPKSARPAALRPVPGLDYPGGFSYARSVQPVLDRHCVRCHGGEKPAAGLDLRGTPEDHDTPEYPFRPQTARFSVSYNRLVDRPGLVALAHRNRESYASRPRDYFAAAGKLAPFLLKGHCKSLLEDKAGFENVVTWLDLNGQYYGDYSWSRPEDGDPAPPADGTCGLTPCRCGCCWVPKANRGGR